MPSSLAKIPKLLVSVRDIDEAKAAIDGGCDVLDMKEPTRGSLGMVDAKTMNAVADWMCAAESTIPLSAAFGEAIDWQGDHSAQDVDEIAPRCEYLRYFKLGLAQTTNNSENWVTIWDRARFHVERFCQQTNLNWIAVAYVDWQRANAPSPDSVIKVATDNGCVGVLFDTFIKDGKSLLEWIDSERLAELAARLRQANQLIAVAGGLNASHLNELETVEPDIVAIRTAACRFAERSNCVTASAVSQFRNQLHSAFAGVLS
jgi:uncharacterized protein (UPF0264 family)